MSEDQTVPASATKRPQDVRRNRKGHTTLPIPRATRAALGLPLTGMLPRRLAYAGAIRDAEELIVARLPDISRKLLGIALTDPDVDAKTRSDTCRYLQARILGAPATAAVAPADDASIPAEAQTERHHLVAALFQGLPLATIDRIRAIVAEAVHQPQVIDSKPATDEP